MSRTRTRHDSREAVRALYREALGAAGERRQDLERAQGVELERVADLTLGALAAGLPLSEVARLVGLSRPTVYALRAQAIEAATNLEFQILSAAAGHGAVSVDHLAGTTRRPESEIANLCQQLRAAELLDLRTASSGTEAVAYYGITAVGEERLDALIRKLGHLPEDTFFAYLPIEAAAGDKVYAETLRRFHPSEFALIAAGTTHDMAHPELALQLRAPTETIAHDRARALFGDILRAAGVRGSVGPIRLDRQSR